MPLLARRPDRDRVSAARAVDLSGLMIRPVLPQPADGETAVLPLQERTRNGLLRAGIVDAAGAHLADPKWLLSTWHFGPGRLTDAFQSLRDAGVPHPADTDAPAGTVGADPRRWRVTTAKAESRPSGPALMVALGCLADPVWMASRFVGKSRAEGVRLVADELGMSRSKTESAVRRLGLKGQVAVELWTPGWLAARYEQGLTTGQVAELLGVSASVVSAARQRQGISFGRGQRAGDRPPVVPELTDLGWMTEQVGRLRRPVEEIARGLGVPPARVYAAVQELGVERPPTAVPLLADDVWLRARYETDRLTFLEIAVLAGCGKAAVRRAMLWHGIALRTMAENARLRRDRTGGSLLDDPVWLRERYETDGLTQARIGAIALVDQTQVSQAMKRHGIVARPPSVTSRGLRPGARRPRGLVTD